MPGGGVKLPGGTGLDVVVDAVDAERAGRVAVFVVPHDVPVAPPQDDAVGLEPSGLAAVREGDRRVGVDRREELRQGRCDREIGEGRVGALAGDAAELAQRLPGVVALEPDRGDRHVERGELVVGEPEVGEVVVARRGSGRPGRSRSRRVSRP